MRKFEIKDKKERLLGTVPDMNIRITKDKKGGEIWERAVPVKKAGRDFDLRFWQHAGAQARFSASWQMLKEYELIKGRKVDGSKFRLRRTVENIQQAQG